MNLPPWLIQHADGAIEVNPAVFEYTWHVFVPWLKRKGLSDAKARAVAGRVGKYVPKASLASFLESVLKADPVEPVSYLAERLKVYQDQPTKAAALADQVAAAARERRYMPDWERQGFESEAAFDDYHAKKARLELAEMARQMGRPDLAPKAVH